MQQTQTPVTLSIPKDVLADMPVAEFGGEIIVIETAADARSALRYLSRQPIVGFDTETRPSFRKGRTHNVALVQLSTDECCFLFRICKTGFIEPLRNFFELDSVVKVGLSIKDDFHGLHKIDDFSPKGFVELQDYVHRYGISDASLQKIYAIIFGQRITKGQRLTNWEAPELTPAQQHYASLDAWACLQLYKYLESGRFDPISSPFTVTAETAGEAV